MKHILSILSLGFIAYVQAQVYKGNYCEYIVPTDLPAKGNNCNNDGYKFVVKGNSAGSTKIRKQFLYVDGKVIIAFVENGKKFSDCTSFTDVTGSVNCKLVTGLPGTSLTSTSGGGDGVLMMGGTVNASQYSRNTQLWGSCSDVVTTPNLPYRARDARSAILGNQIYICGGEYEYSQTASCYVKDLGGTEMKAGPKMNKFRSCFSLNNVGSMLVAIGGDCDYFNMDSVEVLESGVWSRQSYRISPPRGNHCGVTVSSQSVLLIGGIIYGDYDYIIEIYDDDDYLVIVEELNIFTGRVTQHPVLPENIGGGSACTLYQNRVIVTGGNQQDRGVLSLDYSVSGSKWKKEPPMIRGRTYHVIAVLNRKLTVYSGFGNGSGYYEEYNEGKWREFSVSTTRDGSAYAVVSCITN